jgi:hypothetical protein
MMARTSALYDSITTILYLWLPATIVWLLAQAKLEHPPAEDDSREWWFSDVIR